MKTHISEKELANRWSISYRTLQRWRSDGGSLPHFKLGKSIRYPLNIIETYESKNIRIPVASNMWGLEWEK